MSVLLERAMTRRTTGEAVQQSTGRIERYRRWRWLRWLALPLAGGHGIDGMKHVTPTVMLDERRRGARPVDGDGDDGTGEEAHVELPTLAVHVECAVLANAASCDRGERGGGRRLVDRARGRARPRLARCLAEQPTMRRAVVVLVEKREQRLGACRGASSSRRSTGSWRKSRRIISVEVTLLVLATAAAPAWIVPARTRRGVGRLHRSGRI
jgi:hypothetical protein